MSAASPSANGRPNEKNDCTHLPSEENGTSHRLPGLEQRMTTRNARAANTGAPRASVSEPEGTTLVPAPMPAQSHAFRGEGADLCRRLASLQADLSRLQAEALEIRQNDPPPAYV